MDSIETVLRDGPTVDADAIPFSRAMMAAVPRDESAHFISQSQLGWGNDGAGLIAVGSEQNFDLSDDEGLGAITLDCASQIIWLAKSSPELMGRFGVGPNWESKFTPDSQTKLGPYHIYTAGYHASRRNSTWQHLGRDILGGDSDWKKVLGRGCYQIELKGDPAREAALGGSVSSRRISFLRGAFSQLRSTAKVLLFHGKKTHEAARGLAASFLGVEQLPSAFLYEVRGIDGRLRAIQQFDAAGRRVLLTWALSPRALNGSGGYLGLLRSLVHELDTGI